MSRRSQKLGNDAFKQENEVFSEICRHLVEISRNVHSRGKISSIENRVLGHGVAMRSRKRGQRLN